MKVKAAAKINLMLDVLGTLPDGYHSLFMVMQSVGCYDFVEVNKTDTGKIEILTEDERVPKDEKNIAYKAATAFFMATETKNTGISIAIEKHIPMAAGLAGGSAALALIARFASDLRRPSLERFGECGGADVPCALSGGTALCMDKGGVIAPLLPLAGKSVVLCKPQMDVSTVSAYRLLDEAAHLRHADKNAMLYAAHTGDYALLCEKADNVFEQVIEVPARPVIKGVMRSHGVDLTLMSGSGPTVYGLFSDRKGAESCAAELKRHFPETVCCETVGCGVETVSVC